MSKTAPTSPAAPGRCTACGRMAAGYDARRDGPVCPVCAGDRL